jgi:asparagine synthase (glutamine-hydrolysing)
MCGIFGVVCREGEVSREFLARAQQSLAHRGPDDSGTVTIDLAPEPGSVSFAHTRLSIIDLSPLGHQPMQDPITGNWIVFNGEIYNFRELRKELEAGGERFQSHSDTEVILAAYRVWGEECLTRFGGMFAFALWDAVRKRLLLARDPMGIKPLYYHQSEAEVYFCFGGSNASANRTGAAKGRSHRGFELPHVRFRV